MITWTGLLHHQSYHQSLIPLVSHKSEKSIFSQKSESFVVLIAETLFVPTPTSLPLYFPLDPLFSLRLLPIHQVLLLPPTPMFSTPLPLYLPLNLLFPQLPVHHVLLLHPPNLLHESDVEELIDTYFGSSS